MKVYCAIFRLGRDMERGILIKAENTIEAHKLIKNWKGMFLGLTEIIVDSDKLNIVQRKKI